MTSENQKRYFVEFIDGDQDGGTIDSHSADPQERFKVQFVVAMTDNAEVGRSFHGTSMVAIDAFARREISRADFKAAPATHSYRVVDRVEEGNVVWIRLQYSVRRSA